MPAYIFQGSCFENWLYWKHLIGYIFLANLNHLTAAIVDKINTQKKEFRIGFLSYVRYFCATKFCQKELKPNV